MIIYFYLFSFLFFFFLILFRICDQRPSGYRGYSRWTPLHKRFLSSNSSFPSSFNFSFDLSFIFLVYLLTPYSDYVHAAAAAVNAGVNLEDANEQNNSFALLGQALQMGLIKEDVINQVSEGDREEMGSKGGEGDAWGER